MAIDTAALRKAAEGKPSAKVSVTKRWLGEVARVIEEGEEAKAKLARRSESDGILQGLFNFPR